jgi:hypothetical protein
VNTVTGQDKSPRGAGRIAPDTGRAAIYPDR